MDVFEVLGVVWLLVVGVTVLAAPFEPVVDFDVDEWASSRGLGLTPATRPLAQRYLVRVKLLRRLGVIAVAVPLLVILDEANLLAWLPLVPAGYLVGVAAADLTLPRHVPTRSRSASLVPRDVRMYLPRRMIAVLWGLGVVSVALVPVYLAVPQKEDADTWAHPTDAVFVLVGIGSLAVAGALEVVARWMLRRPQPVVSDDLLELDDAIRSSSVHGIVGSGIGLLLVVQSYQWAGVGNAALPVLDAVAMPLAVLLLIGAIFGPLYYGYRSWQVRRRRGVIPGA